MGTESLSGQKITNREALRRLDALAAQLRRPIAALPEAERDVRVARIRSGDWIWALQTYFPTLFPKPFAQMHHEMIAAATGTGVSIVRLPRGWSKTTLAQALAALMAAAGMRKFQAFIGKAGPRGKELLLGVILMLEENPLLAADFGNLKSDIWSWELGFRLANGVWMDQIGRGGSVRGWKKEGYRPDQIWADDIEDDVLVRNPERVRQLIDWWLMAVLPCLAENGTAVWLCTSMAEKSPSSLLLNPEWKLQGAENAPECNRLSFPATNADGHSCWPEVWPDERCKAVRDQIGMTAWMQEYMHKSLPKGGMFRADWFRFYQPGELPKRSELAIVTACDPSARSKSTSDHKAVITLAKHVESGHYYVFYCFLRVATIPEMVEKMFLAQRNYRPITTRIETNAFAELLVYPIRDYEREHRGERLMYRNFESHGVAKETRIMQLQAPFERNLIHFMKGHSDQDTLMEQIEYYGTGERDDGPDCLQMCYEFLRNMVAMPGSGKYHPGNRSAFSDEPLDSDWND